VDRDDINETKLRVLIAGAVGLGLAKAWSDSKMLLYLTGVEPVGGANSLAFAINDFIIGPCR
jgi:hypothetical protein